MELLQSSWRRNTVAVFVDWRTSRPQLQGILRH